jgi:hypothetical protein
MAGGREPPGCMEMRHSGSSYSRPLSIHDNSYRQAGHMYRLVWHETLEDMTYGKAYKYTILKKKRIK